MVQGVDYSGIRQGIGSLLTGIMTNKLSKQAMQGDESALVRLTSINPNASRQIGGILAGRKAEGEAEMLAQQQQIDADQLEIDEDREERNNMLGIISRDYSRAKDKVGYLSAVKNRLTKMGMDDLAQEVDASLDMYAANPAAIDQQYEVALGMFGDPSLNSGATDTAGMREFDHLLKLSQSDDPATANAAKIKLRTMAPAVGNAQMTMNKDDASRIAANQKIIKEGEHAGTIEGKREEGRVQDVIQSGIDASKGVPKLRRSLELLESVKTGGLHAALISAKNMFGIGGADEAELSSNLGEAVLGDLKATFGAAFTAKEGESLATLRAGLGKSTAGNKRIIQEALKVAEKASKRALGLAVKRGDYDTAATIKSMLEGSANLDQSVMSGESEANSYTATDGTTFRIIQ